MKRFDLVALFFVLAALAVMAVGLLTRTGILIPRETARLLGSLVFLSGMTLFTWSGMCLKSAFFGKVMPMTEKIITDGPYQWVRHPLYVSMIASLLGINLMLRSFWGIFSVFVLFLPAVVYRARLEEQALNKKFESNWREYVRKTAFLVPFLW